MAEISIARLNEAERVEFGELAHYRPLMPSGERPIRTGMQISEPGYVAPMHWHPYEEMLLILEGEADVWVEGGEAEKQRLGPGDMVSVPPGIRHSFSTVGDQPMRLLGIHVNPDRVVNYVEGIETGAHGYPLQPDS